MVQASKKTKSRGPIDVPKKNSVQEPSQGNNELLKMLKKRQEGNGANHYIISLSSVICTAGQSAKQRAASTSTDPNSPGTCMPQQLLVYNLKYYYYYY